MPSVAADVQLAWDPNTESEIAGYNVYFGNTPGRYSKPVWTGLNTTCAIKGLSAGTWYFAVTAINSSGIESDFSEEVSRAIDNSPPVISSVQAINILGSGATITWTTDEAADSQIEYGVTTAYGALTAPNSKLSTAHSEALPGLAANTTYHYRVLSRDAGGNLSVSADYTFTTNGSSDVIPPTISAVSSGAAGTAGILVSWITDEISDSQVEYGPTASYGSVTALERTLVTEHEQVLSGLKPGQTYHFRVRSRDSAGNIAVSEDCQFTAPNVAGVAALPSFRQMNALQITSGNSVSVKFPSANAAGNLIVAFVVWDNSSPVSITDSRGNSYTAAAGPVKYSGDRTNSQIFYAKGIASGENTVKAVFSTPVKSWGILYIHEYSGIDSSAPLAGVSSGSGASATMNSGTVKTASPNVLLFVGGISNSNVTLGSNRYAIRSRQYGNLTEDWIAATPGSYSAGATQNGSAWTMQIAAFRAAVKPADTTPPRISAVSAGGLTSSGATITWTTDESSDSQVEYGTTNSYGSLSPLLSEQSTEHSAFISGLSPDKIYHYRVRSRDAAGNLSISGDFTFRTETLPPSAPKYVQGKELSISKGGSVTVKFPFANTVGNLIVAYVVWDNSSPVSISDTRGNTYISAVGPTRYAGDITSAQIFYARNIRGGVNSVSASFSKGITRWGILYVYEYSGLHKMNPLEAVAAGSGASSLMNSGTVTVGSPGSLLFAAGESRGTVTLGSNGYTVRSGQYGNLVEDKVVESPGAYSAAATQNSNAWVMQLAAFRAAADLTAQTTMALPLAAGIDAADDSYAGLSIVNSDDVPATLTFTAVDAAGRDLNGPGIENPSMQTLMPGEQLRIVDRQLFGEGVAEAPSGSWIRLESSTPEITGQFALFNGDMSAYHGARMESESLRTVVIPEVGDFGRTQLTVVNPSSEHGLVSFDAVGQDGLVLASVDRTMNANSGFTVDLSGLFAGLSLKQTGYVRVRTSLGIQVSALVGRRNGTVALTGLDQGAGSHLLYALQYPFGAGTESALSVVNLDQVEGMVTLSLFGEDGVQIGASRSLRIPANGKIYVDDPAYFGNQAGEGYVEIRSKEVRLAGGAVFKSRRQNSAAYLPLVDRLQDRALLGNMIQDDLFSTAIVILNPGSNHASAKIELYAADGSLLASAAESIPPRGRRSRSIRDCFPSIAGTHWDSGYVLIRTDVPVASFSTLLSPEGHPVGAIPAQATR